MDDSRREGVGLEDYLRVLRDRGWIVGVSLLVVFVAVLISSLRTTPMYSASARMVYEPTDVNRIATGYELFSSYDYDKDRTIQTAIAVIGQNEQIAEAVQQQLKAENLPGFDRSLEEISAMVDAVAAEGTNFVAVSATSAFPDETAAIANAFVDQFIAYRQDARRALVTEARDLVQSQLAAMTAEERRSDYGLLMQNKYESLRISVTVTDSDFKLLSEASTPDSPFTPKTKRDIALALVLGLVLGVGLAFFLDYLDRRIKDEKALEKVTGLPVLASVPVVGRSWRGKGKGQRSLDIVGFAGERSPLLESFRTLRSTLQYFNVEGDLHKILLTSGLPLEGKTVTTVNLGIALAMSGKRVIILEADLRRPMVHEYLGLENEKGLSNLLAGTSSVPAVMQLVAMDPLIPARSRKLENGHAPLVLRKNLYCIASGPLPPNPSELLQSARMDEVICELEGFADYVLIDTPPVLPVSDAVTLAPKADAVILVARLHGSTRGEMEQVRERLGRAGARVIGVVAGGVKRQHSYYRRGYNYNYGGYDY